MTAEQFDIIVQTIRSAYPNSKALNTPEAMKLWYRMLGDMDYKLLAAALGHHICTNTFPPTIAELREACHKVQGENAPDWLTGWQLVQKAISQYGYYRAADGLKWLREKDSLAADVAERLGWRALCISENQTADRANFRKAYEAYGERETELKKLPPWLREQLTAVADNLMIGGGDDGLQQ